jgi:hypothetical protein
MKLLTLLLAIISPEIAFAITIQEVPVCAVR